MTPLTTASDAAVTLASEGSANAIPYMAGGGALAILFLLLWITTLFNRDR